MNDGFPAPGSRYDLPVAARKVVSAWFGTHGVAEHMRDLRRALEIVEARPNRHTSTFEKIIELVTQPYVAELPGCETCDHGLNEYECSFYCSPSGCRGHQAMCFECIGTRFELIARLSSEAKCQT